MEDVLSRFLRYVRIDTRSEENRQSPTTRTQFTLARMLAKELEDMGASQVRLDEEHCYVYARIAGDERVLVILSGSDTDRTLDPKRFSEVLGPATRGRDVVTGEVLDLSGPLTIPARSAFVLELQ